jgi:hypothetical protein
VVVDCELFTFDPAHSAAWHVGPGRGVPRFVGSLPAHNASREGSNGKNLKKRGAPCEHPQSRSKNYRFFAAFFFELLAAFFAMLVFSLGCGGSTSDGHHDRHNGWAEPSTLIPDVDYG